MSLPGGTKVVIYIREYHGIAVTYQGRKEYEKKFADLIKLCNEAKAAGVTAILIHSPEVLGDDQAEIIQSLYHIAKTDLALQIMPPEFKQMFIPRV